MDSGVRPTHEALIGKFREYHGFFDVVYGREYPYDDDGQELILWGLSWEAKELGYLPTQNILLAGHVRMMTIATSAIGLSVLNG